MTNAYYKIPTPINEPVQNNVPGSEERAKLKAELQKQSSQVIEIPLVINGERIFTENKIDVVMPHDHGHILAKCSVAEPKHLQMALDAAKNAKEAWADMPFEHRAAIFLSVAERISGPNRYQMSASTMLGQSKTAFQAEIDATCELIDFLRFNAHNAEEIFHEQPQSSKGIWNRMLYRPLDGFVLAISPFNFTAIAGNLGSAPALVGNTILWKPATTSVLSNYYYMELLLEAGLPNGVINFIPSKGSDISKYVISDPNLGGIHFTGSTAVFQSIWAQVGSNIDKYKAYPRLVGETGGKDFVFAHKTAHIDALVTALVRGAFEYQGQKCSAASRAYIPASIWGEVKDKLLAAINDIKMGDVRDFRNFMGAVIDEASFDNIVEYLKRAAQSDDAEILCGNYDKSKGYFISPTVIVAKKPDYETMRDELFGPVLSIYIYEDDDLDSALKLCDEGSAYALTGAIFARDREVLVHMSKALQYAAGNFYINDKPTGAVVGQQPFGGGRASGTNDKAGSKLNIYRWLSPHTIKETLVPITEINYPFMDEE